MRKIKKLFAGLSLIFILNGCAESMALLAPAGSALGSGNIVQSSITSAASFGVKKHTGKSPVEHVLSYMEEHNPDKKKEVCVSFLENTSSEFCAVVKNRISDLKESIKENSFIENLDTE